MIPKDASARLSAKVRLPDPVSGYMEWLGALNTDRYGRIVIDGRARRAHRVVFEQAYGPIPANRDLDHLCRNRSCVRPDHLEPVTRAENIQRGQAGAFNRSKQTCPEGHAYTGDNLRLKPLPSGGFGHLPRLRPRPGRRGKTEQTSKGANLTIFFPDISSPTRPD